MNYEQALKAARRADHEICAAFRVGSRVYGTATPESDHDFVLVLNEATCRNELIHHPNVNVTVRGLLAFNGAIREGNIFTLECVFAPGPAVLKSLSTLPSSIEERARRQVGFSAVERADSDFKKGIKTNNSKRIYHAFRVLDFAQQIMDCGRIRDFTTAKQIYEDVMTEPRPLEEAFSKSFEDRRGLLRANCERKIEKER